MLYYSNVQRDYMTALQKKNEEQFYHGCPGLVWPIYSAYSLQTKGSVMDLTLRSYELNDGGKTGNPGIERF